MANRTSIKAEPGLREDAHMAESRPSYKSYKKKYRKLRLVFDQQMHESEELHRIEQKAVRTMKRLAVENDRLMDLLMDINSSPQIPPERRIDLKLDDDDSEAEDDEGEDAPVRPSKSLQKLINEVPHNDFAATAEHYPEILEQIQPDDPELLPTPFLSADDVDTYLAELDMRLGLRQKPLVPELAQAMASRNSSAANFALRNPTSVYNWLRKHAPKTFLQDLEKDKDKDHDGDEGGRGKKGKGGGAKGNNKRQSAAAARKDKGKETGKDKDRGRHAAADGPEWDEEGGYDVQTTGSARGKRKRDDDGGYRPKGGSSRPAKKRKSKDLGSSRPRKSGGGD